jgi:hypothetical protein
MFKILIPFSSGFSWFVLYINKHGCPVQCDINKQYSLSEGITKQKIGNAGQVHLFPRWFIGQVAEKGRIYLKAFVDAL